MSSAGSERRRLPLPLGRHGRFELIELLGRGGMGAVYRARDLTLGREVAIKVVLHRGERQKERFLREGQIAASLAHPAIVKVHAAGTMNDFPYLACELVPGARTLGEVALKQARTRLVEWVAQAARGLGYAHAQGVIHRDVKPDNLLVDEAGQLRVADFGLAAREGLERMTRTGAVVGTPGYMAPETVTGQRDAVGPATDVWGLGVILFELLSGGEMPFAGSDMGELGVRIAMDEPEDLGSLAPEVPADLVAIVHRCLEKKPADRYPHGDALAEDLERHLAGGQPQARRRRRRPAGSAGLGLAVVAAGLLVAGVIVLTARGGADPSQAEVGEKPTPSLAASPTPSADSGSDPRPGQRAWDDVRGLAPERQILAAERWLESYPDHPERARAEVFLAREAALRPAAVLGSPARLVLRTGTFLGPSRLLTYGEGMLSEWELGRDEPLSQTRMASASSLPLILVLPNGDLVLGSSSEGLVWLRGDSRAGARDVRPLALACSPDGRLLAVAAAGRGIIVLFDVESRRALRTFGARERDYGWLCFDNTGQRLLTSRGEFGYDRSSDDDKLELFDVERGEPLWEVGTQGLVRVIVRLPESEQFLLGYNRGAIEVWDLAQRGPVGHFQSEDSGGGGGFLSQRAVTGSVRGLVFGPSGEALYTVCSGDAGDFNRITAFSVSKRQQLRPPNVREPWLVGCELSPDGRYLAVATGRGVVEVWSTRGLR